MISIIRPGLFTTIQDLGRMGYRRFGMPVAGAMDPFALRAANRLVGNPDADAALEITAVGPELIFGDSSTIAVTGGDLTPALDGMPVPLWSTLEIAPGSRLTFGPRRLGGRAYVAVAGGIDVPLVLGSRATHVRSRTGGIEGRALKAGDDLRVRSARRRNCTAMLPERVRPRYATEPILRVVWATRTADAVAWRHVITSTRYTVTPDANRMGYRLSGTALRVSGQPNQLSLPTPIGSVQVPSDGQPILLMADGQPTGGYPCAGVVITADLPLAAQLLPGDAVRFRDGGLAEARRAYREQRAMLDAALPPVSEK